METVNDIDLIAELMEGVMKKSTSTKIALRIRCWFWREFKGKKKGAFSSRICLI